jgi:hypothetical protein
VGAPKQRALLAMLLLAYREDGVSATRLIDAIWDEEPPATATKALQVHVSHLRRAVGADTIVTRANGYAIEVEPRQLDLERFETLLALVERAAGRGRRAPARGAGAVPRPAAGRRTAVRPGRDRGRPAGGAAAGRARAPDRVRPARRPRRGARRRSACTRS